MVVIGFVIYFFASGAKMDVSKKEILKGSLNIIEKVAQLLPIQEDTKKELEVVNEYVQYFTKEDNVERTFLVMLQNNMELRPGGGFLGQYAIVKIKNGEVTSTYVEDANLLDQRIHAKVRPPYPFIKMMSLKRWKFRDSNFSPDFPTNVEKAKYFYRLSGRNPQFDGVIAVNAQVLADVLELTGPITVPGYSGEYTSENVVLKLEEQVERPYLANPDLDTQNRKAVMKKMASIIVEKLMKLNNIPGMAELAQEEMRNKNVMLNFTDPSLQALAESVHWDGRVANDWGQDYLMVIDSNMGALKSDYYIKREIIYDIDLTQPKPVATLNIKYIHTATHGDWRTSDYHTFLRVYTPKGATLLERKMVNPMPPTSGEEFNKNFFGFKADVVMNRVLDTMIKYELPEQIKNDYRLLIQKQSGVGDVPITVRVKNEKGVQEQKAILKKDLKFQFKD